MGTTHPHNRNENARRNITTAAAALSAAALTVALAGPASAELYGVDDPQDTFHGSDILSLSVRNGHDNVNVTTIHEDLRRDPATGSGGSVFVDTDRNDAGPEYVLVAGFTRGTDYQLLHTEGFAPRHWGNPVRNGDYIMRVDYRQDRVHFRMSRAALGKPGAVRVAVRVSGNRTDGTSYGLVDWVGKRRAFTPWIARGCPTGSSSVESCVIVAVLVGHPGPVGREVHAVAPVVRVPVDHGVASPSPAD